MANGTTIGFIGLGVMGAGMATNLVRRGFQIAVYNRSPEKAESLVALGAKSARDAAEAARGAEAVFLSLPATRDVEEVLFGVQGIAPHLNPGAVVIDTSTIDPVATRDFARRLAASGAELLDCPVSGGQKGAADGTLSCMVGGKAEVVERCRPWLEAVATTIVHVGDSGAGQVCKACNQMCVAITMQGAAEAMALAKAMGVDPYRVREALLGGAAKSVVLERHTKKLLDGDFSPGFRTVLMAKDLGIALEASRTQMAFAPAASLVEQMLRALIASGRGEDDWCSLGALIQSLSGVQGENADRSRHD